MRQIETRLIEYFDQKLASNGLAQDALSRGDARLLFRCAAESLVGVREASGKNDGPLVELMQETIGSAGREPWCMSLVQSCLAYAETKTNKKSSVFASELCTAVWKNTPKEYRVKYRPLPGAIAIWQHGAGPSGHTGVLIEDQSDVFLAVEGNTTAGVSGGKIVREGGGCYLTTRPFNDVGPMELLGFIKPW